MDDILHELEKVSPSKLFGFLIGAGLFSCIFGVFLLIFNRRIIKVLYYFSGVKLFFMLSVMIGFIILLNKDSEFDISSVLILIGSSLAISQVGGILAAVFGKFGVVILGLSGGWDIWQLFAGFVHNDTANLITSLVFALICAVICFFFKRPMEILIAAFTGATCLSFGLYYFITGILGLVNKNPELFTGNSSLLGMISAFVLTILFFVSSLWYHFSIFIEEKKAEHQPLMEEI